MLLMQGSEKHTRRVREMCVRAVFVGVRQVVYGLGGLFTSTCVSADVMVRGAPLFFIAHIDLPAPPPPSPRATGVGEEPRWGFPVVVARGRMEVK